MRARRPARRRTDSHASRTAARRTPRSYDHWKEKKAGASTARPFDAPPLYPRSVTKAAWLRFYSHRFPAVEINSSFYGFPQPETLRKWRAETADGFSIVMKCPKLVTHMYRLDAAKGAPVELVRFVALCVANLGDALGAVLVQLPPNLGRSDANLRAALDAVDAAVPGATRKLAFEFRHASWHCAEVRALLAGRGAAVVQTVTPEDNALQPPAAAAAGGAGGIVYIRCAKSVAMERQIGVTCYGACGAAGRPEASGAIEAVVRAADEAARAGKTCFVFMMNDLGCWAPGDAMLVTDRVGARGAAPGASWTRLSSADAVARCGGKRARESGAGSGSGVPKTPAKKQQTGLASFY